ncbi:MAG: inositol monophosphatase, partial [Thermoguttaceae bacterium]|nr:inositol monophosphatase [Thermoguttaceae bacterium]
GTSGLRWILDPIDGTKSFIHAVPFYSTLIGIEKYDPADPDNHKKSEMLAGVIWLPALKRGVWAQKDEGAFEEHPKLDKPIPAKVAAISDLYMACFLTSEVKTFAETSRAAVYTDLENRCRLTRTWGDAYGYYLVATGRADLMVDPEMSPWDCGPLVTVLAEAGGKFVDWRGSETIYGGDGIAGNRELVDQTLQVIADLGAREPKR